MNERPKTIQIYLPQGDPQGIRFAEITTRIMQVIEVPRSTLSDFLAMPESGQVALYFLISESDEDQPRVYVGQTGDLQTRLKFHNKEKEFWERALVVISRTNSLTQTHAVFLEWYCLNACRKAARYVDENGNAGSKPHTPPPLEADCLEIFDAVDVLLSTLGFPLFDPIVKSSNKTADSEILYCRRAGVEGRGQYTAEGFVVLAGSTGRGKVLPSGAGKWVETLREKLVSTGVARIEGDLLIFEKDYLFRSPSGSAAALTGGTINGWDEWKDSQGRSLDELKRKNT